MEQVGRQQRGLTLSHRERQVVSLIVAGLSSKEIADRLKISLRTVQKHRENIRAKTGARKATELVALAIYQRWVEPSIMGNASASTK